MGYVTPGRDKGGLGVSPNSDIIIITPLLYFSGFFKKGYRVSIWVNCIMTAGFQVVRRV